MPTHLRRVEQDLKTRNFEARNGRIDSNMLVKSQREQRRVHKRQGESWQCQNSGQCAKGDNCSSRHDDNKRSKPTTQPDPSPELSTTQDGKNQPKRKVLEAEASLGTYFECHARIILKALARIPLVKSCILQSACSTSQKSDTTSGKSALFHTAELRNSLAKGPKGPKEMATKVQWLC